MSMIHQAINQMCADLGKNPLLVQGAGGNVSWKEGGTLWIKGSGTWLANALLENIFVPVQLQPLQAALAIGNVDVTPKTDGEQSLRPSIETVLHALMPHPIVIHLHAIHALSHLVTKNCHTSVSDICHLAKINGVFVEYHKPGPELAKAIHKALVEAPKANVVFLKNHGIVVGGDSIEEVRCLLGELDEVFGRLQDITSGPNRKISQIHFPVDGYIPFPDDEVQALALNPQLFKLLKHYWVLYPDHAVFLGPKAITYRSWEDYLARAHGGSELIFIENVGVFVGPEFNKAKTAQLRCYFDVVSRVPANAELDPLSEADISELISWDAEKYRAERMN